MMARLSTRIQNRLKLQVDKYLNETCDISRVDFVQGRVGMREQLVLVSSGVACRVITDNRSQGQGYVETGEHEANVDAFRVILAAGTAVDAEDRITVGTQIYRVIAVVDDLSNALYVACQVRRVRGND
jgi:hypothetical protein